MLFRRRVRMVGEALIIEIVDQPRDSPAVLVLSELARVSPHRTLHRKHVLAQRIAGGVVVHQCEGFLPRRKHLTYFLPGGFGVGASPTRPKSMNPRCGFVEISSTSISSPTSTPLSPRINRPSTGGAATPPAVAPPPLPGRASLCFCP